MEQLITALRLYVRRRSSLCRGILFNSKDLHNPSVAAAAAAVSIVIYSAKTQDRAAGGVVIVRSHHKVLCIIVQFKA